MPYDRRRSRPSHHPSRLRPSPRTWPGFVGSVYEVLLANALQEKGLAVERQKPIPINFRGATFDGGFRADLIVTNLVLVELKSADALAKVHSKQTLTYLRLTNLKVGLLINFGGALLKGNIQRLANGADEITI